MPASTPYPTTQSGATILGKVKAALQEKGSSRIFGLLGPNGAGKSRLLIEIRGELIKDRVPSVLLNPYRNLYNPGYDTPTNDFTDVECSSELIERLFEKLLAINENTDIYRPSLKDIFSNYLANIHHLRKRQEEAHKDALLKWDQGEIPERPVMPPNPVKEAEELLSNLVGYPAQFQHRENVGLQAVFSKGEVEFQGEDLSAGERHVLSLTLLLRGPNQRKVVFLVDEPELYLNETRAIEVWATVERFFPNSVFLYATHNVNFATRDNVDQAYLLEIDGRLSSIDLDYPLSGNIVREIVGSRVQISRREKPIIFCEDAMHGLLISDLFEDNFQAITLSGRDSVRFAVEGEGAWAQVRSEGLPLCGIIDRDGRDDKDVARFEAKRVFPLPYYETESLLVVPELAAWFIGLSAGAKVTSNDVKTWLVASARFYVPQTVQRAASFLQYRAQPELTFMHDSSLGAKNVAVNPPAKLTSEFQLRARSIADAANDGDVIGIIANFSGKDLYKGLCVECRRHLGLALPDRPAQKWREARQLSEFRKRLNDVPGVKEFRQRVEAALS